MRYYIADCHFFHRSLLTKMDCRPFDDVLQMNEVMIAAWNRKVRTNDEVVIIGDLSYGTLDETLDLLNKLNGHLYLIKGNHDNYVKDLEFASRFEWIRDYVELNDNKRKIVISHYPIVCYNGQYRLDENGIPKTYMLYGHVHNTMDEEILNDYIKKVRLIKRVGPDGIERHIPCQMINCFCMFSNYEPLTIEEWIINDRLRRK